MEREEWRDTGRLDIVQTPALVRQAGGRVVTWEQETCTGLGVIDRAWLARPRHSDTCQSPHYRAAGWQA